MAEPLINAPVPAMPTMVSRLPKFGSRPAGGTTTPATPLTNGFHHHPPSATGVTATTGGKCLHIPPPLRQNGLTRMVPSQHANWRNSRGGGAVNKEVDQKDGDWVEPQQHLPRQRQPAQRSPLAPRAIKKPAPARKSKGCGVSSVVSSSTRTVPQSGRTGPRSVTVAARQAESGPSLCKGSKPGLNARTSGQLRSGLLKLGLNPGSRFSSGSRLGSPNSNLPSSRSQSSDSLKSSPSQGEDGMVRSQSLTQVRTGLPSPTLPHAPITRSHSHSFSKPTELPPQARTHLTRSPLARPAPALGGGGRGEARGGGGNESFFFFPSKASAATGLARPGTGAGSSSLIPPTALKKPLLSSPTSSKLSGSAVPYRLTRPSLMKQPRPFLATTKVPGNQEVVEGRRNSLETPPETPDPSSSTESPGSTPEDEGVSEEPEAQGELPLLGETLEDMSLSSTSSLERNDTSEEYMDDFDNLGNGGQGILLLCSHDDGLDQSPPCEGDDNRVAGLHSFLSESVDWEGMGLTGCKRDFLIPSRRPSQVLSGGASLDLSPSDSSGGTYMWDEEGLEPLGSATSHPCGSYDSDLNSLDILNNLDNLESCDLDDDDLMLDADLPDEGSLQSGADGLSQLTHWRGRQLCWGTQDVIHNDNSDTLEELDPLTLTHMAEECSSVRQQLLLLQKMLQLEDDDADQENTLTLENLTPEDPREGQLEELLQEVQELREELRRKDKTIAHLNQQLAVPVVTTRCRCQLGPSESWAGPGPEAAPEAAHQGRLSPEAETGGERVTRLDKTTQTPWRHGAALPAPSLCPPWLRRPPHQGRLRAHVPHHARQTSDTAAPPAQPQRAAPPGQSSPASLLVQRPR